ncbi:MAG: ribosomal-processing cysteine protease Prp [Bacilli bacterium]|nr:ribosomal-processing cysteine protease Prp [Bacilli bacterium]
MIKILCNEKIFSISGHANFAKKGCDIICSAISAIVFGALNAFENIGNIEIKKNNILIQLMKKISLEDKIRFEMMIAQIKNVADNYPKNVDLKIKLKKKLNNI